LYGSYLLVLYVVAVGRGSVAMRRSCLYTSFSRSAGCRSYLRDVWCCCEPRRRRWRRWQQQEDQLQL